MLSYCDEETCYSRVQILFWHGTCQIPHTHTHTRMYKSPVKVVLMLRKSSWRRYAALFLNSNISWWIFKNYWLLRTILYDRKRGRNVTCGGFSGFATLTSVGGLRQRAVFSAERLHYQQPLFLHRDSRAEWSRERGKRTTYPRARDCSRLPLDKRVRS